MQIIVRVGILPGSVGEYALSEGASVKDALDSAGFNPTGYTVTLDGDTVTDLTNTKVTDNSRVLLTKSVKGN